MKYLKGFSIVIFLIAIGSFYGCYTQLAGGGFNRPEKERKHVEKEETYEDKDYGDDDYYTEDYDSTMTDSSYAYEDDEDYTINNYYLNDSYRPFYRRYYTGYHPGISIGIDFGYSWYDYYYYDPFWVSSPFWWDYYYSPYRYVYYPSYYPGYYYPYYYGGGYGHYDSYKYRKNDYTRLRNNDGGRGSVLRTRDTGSRTSGVVSTSRGTTSVGRDGVTRSTGRDRTGTIRDRNTGRENIGKSTRDREIIKRNGTKETQIDKDSRPTREKQKVERKTSGTRNDGRERIIRKRVPSDGKGEIKKPREDSRPKRETTPRYNPPRQKETPNYTPRRESTRETPRRESTRETPRYNPPSRTESPRSSPPSSSSGRSSGGSSSGGRSSGGGGGDRRR